MRIVALIVEREVIERILCHQGLWEQGGRVPVPLKSDFLSISATQLESLGVNVPRR